MAKRGRKPKQLQPPPPVKPPIPLMFFYEFDDEAGKYRWYCTSNPGDVWDYLTKAELDGAIMAAKCLSLRVVDHLPGFCFDPACTEHPWERHC